MSIVSVDTNHDDLIVTVVSDFEAPIEKVWELWADPRKLERWWGPPTHPATIEQHDLIAAGEVRYVMTGPQGDRFRGMWRVAAVDPPTSLEFADIFVDADGTPIADMPVAQVRVRLTERGPGTRMEMRSTFDSHRDLEKWLGTGTLEGQQRAIAQLDAVLGA